MLEVMLNMCKFTGLRLYLALFSAELEKRFYSESSWASLSEHHVGKQKAKNNNKGIEFGVHSLSTFCTSLVPAVPFSFMLLMTTEISWHLAHNTKKIILDQLFSITPVQEGMVP